MVLETGSKFPNGRDTPLPGDSFASGSSRRIAYRTWAVAWVSFGRDELSDTDTLSQFFVGHIGAVILVQVFGEWIKSLASFGHVENFSDELVFTCIVGYKLPSARGIGQIVN